MLCSLYICSNIYVAIYALFIYDAVVLLFAHIYGKRLTPSPAVVSNLRAGNGPPPPEVQLGQKGSHLPKLKQLFNLTNSILPRHRPPMPAPQGDGGRGVLQADFSGWVMGWVTCGERNQRGPGAASLLQTLSLPTGHQPPPQGSPSWTCSVLVTSPVQGEGCL